MASKVQDFGFRGKRRVSIQEPLFLYVEWGEQNPDNNEEIRDIIEEIDLDLYPHDSSKSIKKNFPFLTFLQAESLFEALKENFDNFTFNGIALVSQANRNTLISGRVEFGEGPRIAPFVLDDEYQNIPLALIYATRRDPRFSHYSFDDLTKYFCTIEPNLMECYRHSLGLSVTDMPIYPTKNTIKGELNREGVIGVTEQEYIDNSNTPTNVGSTKNSNSFWLKFFGFLSFSFALISIGIGLVNLSHISKHEEKINYVYKEQTKTKQIQDNEHDIDVVAKYFVTFYFSGSKEAITPYLSEGDAKFTQPTKAQVTSNILEKISLNEDGETYSVSYIVGIRTDKGTSSLERISFDMKADDKAQFKWVVTSEPLKEPYPSTKDKKD
ncbi:MAG: hypothetical protein D8H99_69875 [Streptococcus sp.]|jgi:hypothetical protein|nr:MAG: hypothetical protein D8H99_69875 [Streptococcus sp.]